MKQWLVSLVIVSLVAGAGFAAPAVDRDNNGIVGDEPEVTRPPAPSDSERTDVVLFPTSADTWEMVYYPNWWNAGDTVYGIHDVSLPYVNHADVQLKINTNVLTSEGHVDLDLQIDGITVGGVVITGADGLGYVYASFDFADMTPPFELRWIETNTVTPGAGSAVLDESGECLVDFSGDPVAVERPTWTAVKSIFR